MARAMSGARRWSALRVNTVLQTLYLSSNGLDDVGGKAVGEVLHVTTGLQALDSSCAGQLRLNLSFIIVSHIALSLHLLFSSSSLSLEGSSDNKQNHQLENKIILSSTSRYPRSQHASHRHDVFAGVFNCHCEYVLDSAQTLCAGTARFECWKEPVLGLTLRTPDSESESKRIIVWRYMCIQRERERS